MQAKDIMCSEIKSCGVDANLDTIASLMWNEDCGIVPIVSEDNRLEGVITDRDITMAATLKHRPLWEINASELLQGKTCHTCQTDDNIQDVLEQMGQYQLNRMPVVDAQNHVIGMLAIKDIVEHTKTGKAKVARNSTSLSSSEVAATLQRIRKTNGVSAAA